MLRISERWPAARVWPARLWTQPGDSLQAFCLVTGLIVVALVWAGVSYHLDRRQTAIREQAHHDVLNLSIALEKHVERLLVGVDQVLRFMAEDFRSDPEGFDFEVWLKRSTSLEAVAHQISMYDAAGELVASRTPLAPGFPRFTVRDRAYFQALSARDDPGLYIDRTFKGRLTGRYALQTARRLSRGDGSFAGVIVISIDPGYLSRQFETLDVGRQGSVAMFGHDGYVRARFPQSEGMYEQNATTLNSGKGVFAYLKESPAGSYEVRSAFDGVIRIFGYRTVGSLPLVVTVGKSLDEVMTPFQDERSRALLAGLSVTAFVLAVQLGLARGLERMRQQGLRLAAANQNLAEKETVARAAEVQAQDANRLLTLAAQIAHIGHWRIELPKKQLTWSEEIFRIYGLEAPVALTVEVAIEAYHPEDRAMVARCVDEAMRDGKAFDFSARVVRPDGSLRDVISRGLCEIDADGGVAAIFGTFMDVTEIRRTERAALESEARYRLLAENMSELIMLGHDDGRRSYISPASHRLLGFDPDELAAMSLRDYVHPDDLARLFAITRRLAQGADEMSCVYRALHKQSGWIWVEGVFRRIPGAGGDEPSIVATFRDVSERERQARLLEDARIQAEAGGRAKAEFLANMSHELRTPLTGMLGVHDLLSSDPTLSQRQKHLIGLAQDSGRSLLAIVNDILDFSKIEAGQLTLEPLPFSLGSLLESCRQLATETLQGKSLAIEVERSDEMPDWLVADAARLRQVLLNLLTNATKFTSAGRICVRASCDMTRMRLRVEVEDTGIGIPADTLPLLFERFSQADASMSRRYGGTGLGLAICKRLIQLMDGEIGARSEPGRGSTFWFEIPLSIAENGREEQAVPTLLADPARRSYRLLVAEDNIINQQILRAALEQKGHRLTLVGDGAAAVAMRQAGEPFDLILMDVQMPGVDGIAAARAIRSWEQAHEHSRAPIIALTANALPEEVARCRTAGMDAHVAKPIDWGTLFSTMDRVHADRGDGETSGDLGCPPETRILDQALLDELAQLLGAKGIRRLMTSFVAEIRKRVALMNQAAAANEIVKHAHVLDALAGQLGFVELSTFCADLKEQTQTGAYLDDLRRLPAIAERALRAAADTSYVSAA